MFWIIETFPPRQKRAGGGDGEEYKKGVPPDAGGAPVDGLPGKKGLVEELVKSMKKEFRLMLEELQWMDSQVKRGWWRKW